MTLTDQIIEELNNGSSTTHELAQRLGAQESSIRAALSRLREKDLITSNDKRRKFEDNGSRGYKIYKLKTHSDLADVHFFMSFFQSVAPVLQEHAREELIDNGSRFEEISKKLEEREIV